MPKFSLNFFSLGPGLSPAALKLVAALLPEPPVQRLQVLSHHPHLPKFSIRNKICWTFSPAD